MTIFWSESARHAQFHSSLVGSDGLYALSRMNVDCLVQYGWFSTNKMKIALENSRMSTLALVWQNRSSAAELHLCEESLNKKFREWKITVVYTKILFQSVRPLWLAVVSGPTVLPAIEQLPLVRLQPKWKINYLERNERMADAVGRITLLLGPAASFWSAFRWGLD